MDRMQSLIDKVAKQHLHDLTEQLAEIRERRRIRGDALDQHLQQFYGMTRLRESGRCLPLLTEFLAWSRALGLIPHLVDEYGRILPAWSPHRPPDKTDATFEACRIMRSLDERRRVLPCDLAVLGEYLRLPELSPLWYERWMLATPSPDLHVVARVCVALDVRLTLIRLWHGEALTAVHELQADSDHSPDIASASCQSAG